MAPRRPADHTSTVTGAPVRRSSRIAGRPRSSSLSESDSSSFAYSFSRSSTAVPSPSTLSSPFGHAPSSAYTMAGIPQFDNLNSIPEEEDAELPNPRTRVASGVRRRRPNAPRPPPAYRRSSSRRSSPRRRICDFCLDDPLGRAMHAQRPCDWQDGTYPLECTNCADHRARNPVAAAKHVCSVPRKPLIYRKYSTHHPARYDQAISPFTGLPTDTGVCCIKCAADGKAASCDVDPILGYQCSRCKPTDMCRLSDNRVMDSKPNVRQGIVKWFRHACDGCTLLAAGRRRGPTNQCSWLADRTTWNQPCTRSRDNNLLCLSSALVASMPVSIYIPENWRPRSFIALGWAELRPNTAWRKACMNCRRDHAHCRASIAHPLSACGRCTAMGLDCVDCEGIAYPIFDLSQVGFGKFMPYTACRRCVEMGRNCDKQRPCDSCINAGEAHLCDNAFLKTEAGKKRMTNCVHGRLQPPPGPLYYLALGYGANGVDDAKDGSRMEHWIGPITETYAEPTVSFHEGTLMREVSRQRESLIPRSTPPHAAPGTPLAGKSTSQLTANEIAAMIVQVWPNSFLMNTLPDFAAHQRAAAMKKDEYRFEAPAGTDNPPTAAEIAAAVNPNNLDPTPIVRVIQPLPVVVSTAAAADVAADANAETEESEEYEESGSSEDGNGGNSFQMVHLPLPAMQSQAATDQSVLGCAQPSIITDQPEMIFQHIMQSLPEPGVAPFQVDQIYQQLMQTVATIAPISGYEAMDVDAQEDIPIDPALQPWNPPSPPPALPYVSYSPLPTISLETNSMPGHAMTLPANPPMLDVPNIYTVDLLDPQYTSFFDAPAATAEWPPASNNGNVQQQANAPLSPIASFLHDAEATTAWLPEDDTTSVSQQMYGPNPFQAMPLQVEEQNQRPPAAVPSQSAGQQGSARWRHLNPLHESTRTLLGERDNTGDKVVRKPFTLSINYLERDCPINDVLHSLPEPRSEDRNEDIDMQIQKVSDPQGDTRCDENGLGEGNYDAYLACGAAVNASDRCADMHHHPNHPSLVCNSCAQQSAQALVNPEHNPLTAVEVLKMRSYLCDKCTAFAGSSPQAMLDMCEAGINTVYGWFPKPSPGNHAANEDGDAIMTMTARDGGEVKFLGDARPLTGCSCGVKLFQTRQCQFHRIDNAEAVLHQVAAVREWRIQTLQEGKCAGCFEYRSAADVPMQDGDENGQQTQMQPAGSSTLPAALSSWVCLACGGWVMNQVGPVETSGLVDGWQSWFNPEPVSLAGDVRDIEMSDP
ncbi:Zn(2)-C6 fungal-type DNA-binding domain protein [Akanthomyces lecanii RCEF 1005]|uniref:Zn(2)-C6 fungal-type DNA-binding domain protein n=1 Tax=Akanthomyces lecanii RCEF 1005 TaxID=1081108 RepID=A0A168IXU1_CORDF|nr:Zn(2)-C6 fungal-type DNA-binding domain protein [Akanthomyces lecanii RCEF 1005]